VVAGYSLFFAVSRGFVESERLERHQQLVVSLSDGLGEGRVTLPLPQGLGVDAHWANTGFTDPAQTIRSADGRVWLVSRTRLAAQNQESPVLEVRQDITASVERSQRDLRLLIAVAGASLLFTSVLLRLVIWRGLIQPLSGFARELEQLEADSLGVQCLDPAQQPSELLPIVVAFNALQSRLAKAWEQERFFVDGVAHELRTPISVISGHAQQLSEQPLPPTLQPPVDLIEAEARRMGQLLRVLLELARNDSGRLTLAMQQLDPEDLLLVAYERLLPLAPDRLQLAAPSPTALMPIHADPDRLQQCLAALVENAIAYSPGAIQLFVTAEPEQIVLHVLDQGPGIPDQEKGKVLERFTRGSTATGTRGSGLGLSLVQQLIGLMGADLLMADAPGGGADVQLRFQRVETTAGVAVAAGSP